MKTIKFAFVALAAMLMMVSCGSDNKEAAGEGKDGGNQFEIVNPKAQWEGQEIIELVSTSCEMEDYSVESGIMTGSVTIPVLRLKFKLLKNVADVNNVYAPIKALDKDDSPVRYLGKKAVFKIYDSAQGDKLENLISSGKVGDIVEVKYRLNVKELNVDSECQKVKEQIKKIKFDDLRLRIKEAADTQNMISF